MEWAQVGTAGALVLTATGFGLGSLYLLRAWSSRSGFELALGSVLFVSGGVAAGLNLLHELQVPGSGAGRAVLAATLLSANVGTLFAFVFAWRVFRPESRATLGVLVVTMILLLGTVVAQGVADGFRGSPEGLPPILAGVVVRALVFGWIAVETGARYVRQRRQLALGLGDPVVCNRYMLFSVATGSIFLSSAVSIAIPGSLGAGLVGLCRLVSVGALLLACVPPQAYLRWVQAEPAAS